jgi:hypothetical protein
VAQLDRGERRDGVDEQECGMTGTIDGASNFRQPARDARRRFVVDDQQGSDVVPAVLAESRFERVRIDAVPPVARHDLDVEPEPARDLHPVPGKLPNVESEDTIARRQRIDQGGFPGAAARGRKDHDRPGGLEDPVQTFEDGTTEGGELGAPMVDRRLRHRTQHAIGCVGRSGYLKEVTAGPSHAGNRNLVDGPLA